MSRLDAFLLRRDNWVVGGQVYQFPNLAHELCLQRVVERSVSVVTHAGENTASQAVVALDHRSVCEPLSVAFSAWQLRYGRLAGEFQ